MKAKIGFLWKQISKKKNFQGEVTNICNLRCPACPWHTVMTRELHAMTVEEWDIIFNKIKKEANSIGFYMR